MEEIVQALANIGFDWRVALANFVNFLIVFYLLNRFIFKPMAKTLKERKEHIQEGVENAQKAETSLVTAKEEGKQIVHGARSESNEIVKAAREQERGIVSEAQSKAAVEANRMLEEARQKAKEEKEKMQAEVQKEASALVVEGVKRLLKEEVTQQKGEAIIKDIVRG